MKNSDPIVYKTTRYATLIRLFTVNLLILLGASTLDAAVIHRGTLTPLTGGDAGEGLDLSGAIIHAYNLGGPAQTVQGVTFAGASVGAVPAGITTTGSPLDFDYGTINPGSGADYGTTANDDAVESMITSVWYGPSWTFDMEVVPGDIYKFQLLLQEGWLPLQGTTARNFDFSVEQEFSPILGPGISSLVLGQETNGRNQAGPDNGLLYSYVFTATDTSFRIALSDAAGSDPNAVLSALLLTKVGRVPEPSTLPLLGGGTILLTYLRRYYRRG